MPPSPPGACTETAMVVPLSGYRRTSCIATWKSKFVDGSVYAYVSGTKSEMFSPGLVVRNARVILDPPGRGGAILLWHTVLLDRFACSGAIAACYFGQGSIVP